MNVRHGLAATLLVAGLLTVTACGSQQAGTPVPVTVNQSTSAVTTSAGSSSGTESAPTTADTTPAATDSTAASSADDPSTEPTSSGPIPPTTSPAGGSVHIDQITQNWVTGMCTDMGALLVTVFDLPKATAKSPVADYRQAFVDYYSHIAQAAQTALDDAQGATPPNVPNGAEIHQAFVRYLTGLADIATNGAALLDRETTAADISADIKQINHEIEDLGNGDFGMGNISSPALEAAVKSVPACQNLVSQG